MAVFPPFYINYTDPVFDSAMNYGCGISLIIIFILSVFLNILAFYTVYTQQELSSTKVLFLFMILSDLIYSLVKDPFVINDLLNPRVLARVPLIKATTLQMVVSEISWLAVHASINSIFGITILRFVRLVFPWWSIAHKTASIILAIVPMLVIAGYSIVVEVLILTHERYMWDPSKQDILLDNFALYMPPVFIPAGLSLIFSVATLTKLRAADQMSDTYNRGSVTLILLSVGNLSWIVEALWTAYTDRMHPKAEVFSDFMAYVMIPSFLAFYNPLVLCTRKSQVREMIRRFTFTTSDVERLI